LGNWAEEQKRKEWKERDLGRTEEVQGMMVQENRY
jgi:hypothetical protein